MSSAAQATANFANAQFSSGPRTDAGKAVSSRNSLKHGLTSQTVLLEGENQAAYLKLCAGMLATLAPANEQERALVQTLSDTQWRISRCSHLEAGILSVDDPDLKALDVVSRHENRLSRIYISTLKQVRELIDARLAAVKASVKEAMRIRRADKIKGRSTNFQEIGFVLSTAQVDVAIAREDALTQAEFTINKSRFDFAAPRK